MCLRLRINNQKQTLWVNIKSPYMIALKDRSRKTVIKPRKSSSQQAYFFQEVIEGLQDGVLILTETGELVHANASAYRIVYQLNQSHSTSNFVPCDIWHICKSLIETRSFYPDKMIIMSNEIVLDKSSVFLIRVRWLDLQQFAQPCLLVTIENRYESLKNAVQVDVIKYELTPRESEIWILYRANCSYKEIADRLYISLNTVKKHMKNIHAKRQAFCGS
jgi:hypothetical protein